MPGIGWTDQGESSLKEAGRLWGKILGWGGSIVFFLGVVFGVGSVGCVRRAVRSVSITTWPGGVETRLRWIRTKAPKLEPELPDLFQERERKVALLRARGPILVCPGPNPVDGWETPRHLVRLIGRGADGFLVPLHRTCDGYLVVARQATVDSLCNGVGRWEEFRLEQLLNLESRTVFGRALFPNPVTWTELLNMARRCLILFHPVVPDAATARLVVRRLDQAKGWDLITGSSGAGASLLLQDPHFRPFPNPPQVFLNGSWLQAPERFGLKTNQSRVWITEEPLPLALALGRSRRPPCGLTITYRFRAQTGSASDSNQKEEGIGPGFLIWLERTQAESLPTLKKWVFGSSSSVSGSPSSSIVATERLLRRIAAIVELSRRREDEGQLANLLESVVEHPTRHPDVRLDRMDGVLALRGLEKLREKKAVEVIRRVWDQWMAQEEWKESSAIRWGEELTVALAELGERQDLRRLERLAQDRSCPESCRAIAVAGLVYRAKSYVRLVRLLKADDPLIRAVAFQECIEWARQIDEAAIQTVYPWVTRWPGLWGTLP